MIRHSLLYIIPPVKMVLSALSYQFPPVKMIENDPYEFLIVLMWLMVNSRSLVVEFGPLGVNFKTPRDDFGTLGFRFGL